MRDRRIRVLQLVEGFGRGGAEKKLHELIERIDRNRFDTTICSLDIGGRDLEEEFRNTGYETVILPRKSRVDWQLVAQLIDMIHTRRIDVVMTTLYYADVLGQLAAALGRVRAVYSWETSSAPEYLVTRRLWPYRMTVRFADKVVAVSKAVASYLADQRHVPRSKIEVIPYGVDLSRYSAFRNGQLREQFGLSRKHVVIGMVGRLEPDKGHDILIETASRMNRSDVRFMLAGQGSLEPSLKQEVRERGLEEQFVFLGFRKDIHRILPLFDIVTLPSLHEGLPNAILEAMAVGKPVVATAVGGIPEAVVHNETGILIEPGSSDSLETALEKLINTKALREEMGASGRRRMENVYSLEKQIEAFETLLSSKFSKSA
jgi:glycosyltransferase involved in cell wall biosynthesis